MPAAGVDGRRLQPQGAIAAARVGGGRGGAGRVRPGGGPGAALPASPPTGPRVPAAGGDGRRLQPQGAIAASAELLVGKRCLVHNSVREAAGSDSVKA